MSLSPQFLTEAAFSHSPLAIVLIRQQDGCIIDVNPQWVRLTGFSRHESLGRCAADTGSWARTAQTAARESYEATLLTARQETCLVAVHCHLLLAGGERLGLYQLRDITTERRMVDQLRHSELRFRSFTRLGCDWYWEQDHSLRLVRVDCNPQASHTLPIQEYLGKTRWESGAQGVGEAAWSEHRKTLQQHQPFHDFELQRMAADGRPVWISLSGVPIFDGHGNFCGYWGTGRDITARKSQQAELDHLAFYDALTGLPNRLLLLDRLRQALEARARQGGHGALLLIDLDDFQGINRALGHAAGDQLLQQAAQRLQKCVRSVDTVARLGGDKFVLMLEDMGEIAVEAAAQAESIATKVLDSLCSPYELAGNVYCCAPSLGIVMFSQCRQTCEELLQQAEQALGRAKLAGRSTLRFFSSGDGFPGPVSSAAQSGAELQQALLQEELALHYQPQVDAAAVTTGFEALLRWLHPQRGLLDARDFIGEAEQAGLGRAMGLWVLRSVCHQLKTWAGSPATWHLTVSVNLGAGQFRDPDFARRVLQQLEESGACPARLRLELTEDMLLLDLKDAAAKMDALRAAGVGFSLNGLGTGYSSLAYLQHLPFDQLKIGRSWVRELLDQPGDMARVRSVLRLAQSLGLEVLAEGVETSAQLRLLLLAGCTAFQGYLFGRPAAPALLNLSRQPLWGRE